MDKNPEEIALDQTEEEGLNGLDVSFDDYQVVTSPNDFNISSIIDFIDKGVILIPGFQRNYVWDIKRASKLIESNILNLPIPQIFLYEQDSKFFVIDGQQRLMTIYYFKKGRFPKKESRPALRNLYFKNGGKLPSDILASNDYFQEFKLALGKDESGKESKINKLSYNSLGNLQSKFDLRTLRSITIKQNVPENDDSSMYEIFNRLNTGGMSLGPQEIRASMYHSPFYDLLSEINLSDQWRKLLRAESPDLHLRDLELLLRGIAILIDRAEYRPSMVSFLNRFSKKMKFSDVDKLDLIKKICVEFLNKNFSLDLRRNNKVNVSLFEAVFYVSSLNAWAAKTSANVATIDPKKVESLKNNPDFEKLIAQDTTGKNVVNSRLDLATRVLL